MCFYTSFFLSSENNSHSSQKFTMLNVLFIRIILIKTKIKSNKKKKKKLKFTKENFLILMKVYRETNITNETF